MDVVAKAEVQSDGSFELRLDEGADLSGYASESGDLNLELSAEFDGGLYEQNIALDLGDVEDAEPDEAPLQSIEVAEPIAVAPDTSQASGYVEKACFTKKLKEYPSQWVPIASIFSTNTGTVITHTYTSGHTSTLGVAVSKTSAGSGFSASGSVAVSSTGEIGYAPIKGKTSKQLRTKFQYAKFLHACAGKGSSTQKWVVRPYNRIGGSSSVAATIPAAKFCVPYRKNDHYTRDQKAQTTISTAVTLEGVGLSSQTDWTKSGKTKYQYKSKAGKLCGVKANAADTKKSPGAIVAK